MEGRWKCLPIADSRNNGHIYGGVYYMWHRASRGAAKQNVKNQSPKSENKSQSRRAKVAGQNKRRPEKLSDTQKRQLEKGLEKSKLSERPAYLANTPEPGGTPSPTLAKKEGRRCCPDCDAAKSLCVAFGGRIKRMLMSSMRDWPSTQVEWRNRRSCASAAGAGRGRG